MFVKYHAKNLPSSRLIPNIIIKIIIIKSYITYLPFGNIFWIALIRIPPVSFAIKAITANTTLDVL